MKNLQRNLLKKCLVFIFVLCMLAPISAFAATGTYNSYYDFTGGLFTQYFKMDSHRNVTVHTYPNLKYTDPAASRIDIELRKSGFFGDKVVDSSWNYARQKDHCTVTTKDAGSYRIYYIANPKGIRYYGSTTIDY